MTPQRLPFVRTKVLAVYGTRPEAIKMAPVIWALRRRPERFDLTVVATAQHREMLDQVQGTLDLAPDRDLDLMRPGQGLNELAARVLAGLDPVLAEVAPDWLLVQGDTTTVFTAALAAFHRGIRIGHVESGLRTGDLAQPFPEEANRQLTDRLSRLLFAPTEAARQALLAEGLPAERIHVTGNTVVDALQRIAARLGPIATRDEVLVTVHRRESFGAPLAAIFAALAELARRFPSTRFFFPVHPNPNVRGPARELLAGLPNLELAQPVDYLELVRRLLACRLVLTDSGGLQEEAPTFGKPVLVLRDKTERPEGVAAGVARLVGSDRARIVAAASELLSDEAAYRAMATAVQPYGDGEAGERIVRCLEDAALLP